MSRTVSNISQKYQQRLRERNNYDKFQYCAIRTNEKLAEGTVAREDISAAMQMARALGSESARVLYVQIKRQVEANEEKESEQTE